MRPASAHYFVGQDRLAGLRALSLEAEQRGCVTAQDGSEAGGGEARGGGAVYRVGEATVLCACSTPASQASPAARAGNLAPAAHSANRAGCVQ
jgi:hypothetical protein